MNEETSERVSALPRIDPADDVPARRSVPHVLTSHPIDRPGGHVEVAERTLRAR